MKSYKFVLFFVMLAVFGTVKSYSMEELLDEKVLIKRPKTASAESPFCLVGDAEKTFISFIGDLTDLVSLSRSCKYCYNLFGETLRNRIFIIGPTGSGKSTLTNLLCGKPLIAEEYFTPWQGFRLTASESLPTVNIGHGACAGTSETSVIINHDKKRIILDCTGFGDPRGPEQDWVNAQVIHKFLNGNISVASVLTENLIYGSHGKDFHLFLNKMTEIFPDQNQLQKLMSLVVSHNKQLIIPSYFECYKQGESFLYLSQRGKELIQFFVDNPSHIIKFSYPTQEGPYEISPELGIFLDSIAYVSNPLVTAPVKESVMANDYQKRWSSLKSYYSNQL